MANDRVQAAKKLRKAIQIALSNVDLDEDDITEIGSVIFDEYDDSEKYKKGMIVVSDGVTYTCLKTTKNNGKPANDTKHWAKFNGSSSGETGGDAEDDGIPVWSQPKDDKTYRKGSKVHYPDASGPVYVSHVNKNTSEPGTNDDWVIE